MERKIIKPGSVLIATLLILGGTAAWAYADDSGRIESAQEDYEARKLIRRAEFLADEGKLEEALGLLKEAKERVRDEKKFLKVDKLAAQYEKKLIEQERRKREFVRQTEKKRMLMEVSDYWLPPVPEEKKPEKPAKESSLEERAKKKIPLIDFHDATLKEVVEFLARASEVNVVIDEKAIPKEERVTVHLRDIAMIDALNYVLKTKKLASRMEKDLILVTTPAALEAELEVRVYDVQDLVGKLHDFPASPFNFGEIAKRTEKGEAAKQ